MLPKTPRARESHRPPAPAAWSAARDRAALAAALDPIITIDSRGVILSASDSVAGVFGWQPHELVGRNVSVLMPEPHRSQHDGHLARYARTGETNIMGRPREFEGVRRDGTVFPIELCVTRAPMPGHAEPVFVGIVRDITERLHARRALIEQKRSYETLIEHLPGVVFRLDRSLRHVLVGGAVERIKQLKPDRFLGRSGRELGFPDDLCDRFEAVCRRVFATGEAEELEFKVNGVWLHHRVRPELDDKGSVATLLVLAEDISQRKRIEAELAGHRDGLERIVHERTEQLRLVHQQSRVTERMAAIGTLAAGLGHDMNNVLLPVRAHLNAALAAARPPSALRVRRAVKQVQKSIDYLQQLADGLHFLAADPESDNGGGPGEGTDLARWWAQTGVLLSKPVPRHVRVVSTIPPLPTRRRAKGAGNTRRALPEIAIASHRLTQAVLNLVVNAGQAIPPPGELGGKVGLVRVSAKVVSNGAEHRGGKIVRLCVKDNGTGMTEEVKAHAFDMFFTTKVRGMGTGLGLPLVARVVNNAGGSVRIESALGKGTTVILDLPIVPPAARSADGISTAVLSVGDPRIAHLVKQILAAAEVRVAAERDLGDADLWVVDSDGVGVARARAWIAGRARPRGSAKSGRRRAVVVLGPLGKASRAAWARVDPVFVDQPDDFIALRDGLGLALHRPQ